MANKRIETTEYNQSMQIPGLVSVFSYGMAIALRSIAVVFGVISVMCNIINIYVLSSFHKNSIVFRHEFLSWLFCLDLSKNFILTVFPLLTLITTYTYDWSIFYNIVGFLSNLSTVAADFIVFFISLHFVLLIFKPSLNVIDHKRNKVEGGLFKYKTYVFTFIVSFATLCSALVFINYNTDNSYLPKADTITKIKDNDGSFQVKNSSKMGGYKPYATVVGLPVLPIYYSLFLNWLWRYCIMICIIVIYILIYVKYQKESKANQTKIKNLQRTYSDNSEDINTDRQQIENITKEFDLLLAQEFSKRKKIFKKQMYQLFLYPTCYLILWICPLIESIEQPIYDIKNGPMVPITIITTICHLSNGIFDFIIFMSRENPFEHYWSKIETKILKTEYLENKAKNKMNIKDKWELCNETLLGKRGFYYSGNAINNIVEDERYIITNHSYVKWYWRLYHRFPLRHGIDLDLLEVSISKPQSDTNSGSSSSDTNATYKQNKSNVDKDNISNISETEMFAMVSKFKNRDSTSKDLNNDNNAWIDKLLIPNEDFEYYSNKDNNKDLEKQLDESASSRSSIERERTEILDILDVL